MTPEHTLIKVNGKEKYVTGYFLQISQLEGLVNHFIVSDPMDERLLNVKKHIEQYLKGIKDE